MAFMKSIEEGESEQFVKEIRKRISKKEMFRSSNNRYAQIKKNFMPR